MTQLISYKNDPKLKQMMVKEARKHKKADAYIKGTYEKRNGAFKGCAIGCAIESLNVRLGKSILHSDHAAYETELGFPKWLAYLEDTLFENLPDDESKNFPLEMLEAIPVGVNLKPVKWKLCAYLMNENIDRVLGLKIKAKLKKKVVSALRQCLAVHESAIKTGVWDKLAADSAESATWSAQESITELVAKSVAWSLARSLNSARSGTWSAVDSVAWSVESVTESESYTKYKNKLIELLKSTELVEEEVSK